MKAFDGKVSAAPLGILNWDVVGMALQGKYLGRGEPVGDKRMTVETARFQIGARTDETITVVCPTILGRKLDDFKLEGKWVAVVYRGKVALKDGQSAAKQFDVFDLGGQPESAGVHRPGTKADPEDGDLPF